MVDNKNFKKGKLMAQIEALIFSAEEPVSVSELAEGISCSNIETELFVEKLKEEYQKKSHGIILKEYHGGYLFVTKADFSSIIHKFHDKKITSLSQAALETLAIIAYKQPVTRAEIEEIRGVKVEKTLITLNKYDLIEELGRKDTIGNPIVYGTTDNFLYQFGIKSLSELPEVNIEKDEDIIQVEKNTS